MRTQQRVHRRSKARGWNEGKIHIGHAPEPLEAYAESASGADSCERYLARLGSRGVNEVSQPAIGRGAIDGKHGRRIDQAANRLEARQRIVVRLLHERVDEQAI